MMYMLTILLMFLLAGCGRFDPSLEQETSVIPEDKIVGVDVPDLTKRSCDIISRQEYLDLCGIEADVDDVRRSFLCDYKIKGLNALVYIAYEHSFDEAINKYVPAYELTDRLGVPTLVSGNGNLNLMFANKKGTKTWFVGASNRDCTPTGVEQIARLIYERDVFD